MKTRTVRVDFVPTSDGLGPAHITDKATGLRLTVNDCDEKRALRLLLGGRERAYFEAFFEKPGGASRQIWFGNELPEEDW